MYTFVVREFVSGVLLPLKRLIAWLEPVDVASWRFREMKFHYGRPFGHGVREFERMTGEASGFMVSSDAFRDFLNTDFQIVDGELDACNIDEACLLTLNCVDSSQWEVTTASEKLAADLERRGFLRQPS